MATIGRRDRLTTASEEWGDNLAIVADWVFRPASVADVEAVAELRAVVLRPDLERLGRYDGERVRQRLRDGFTPEHTWMIEVGDRDDAVVRLNVLRGSPARRLYERHGFTVESEDEVDVFMVRSRP